VYVVTHAKDAPPKWTGKLGYLTEEMIAEVVPDYALGCITFRTNAMVEIYDRLILS